MADIDNCDGSNYLRRACDAGTGGGGGGGGSEFNKKLTNGDGIGILDYDGSVARTITVNSSVVRNTTDQVIAGGLTVEKLISNGPITGQGLDVSGVFTVEGDGSVGGSAPAATNVIAWNGAKWAPATAGGAASSSNLDLGYALNQSLRTSDEGQLSKLDVTGVTGLLSSGNVGIGTTNPQGRLEVLDAGVASAVVLKCVTDDQNPYGLMVSNDTYSTSEVSGFGVLQRNDGSTRFFNDNSSYMTVSTDGNVGIGTTNPAGKLSLPTTGVGASAADGITLGNSANTHGLNIWSDQAGQTVNYFDSVYDSATSSVQFRTRTAGTAINAMTIKGDGNVGIGTTAPSVALDVAGNLRAIQGTAGGASVFTNFQGVGGDTTGSQIRLMDSNGAVPITLNSNGVSSITGGSVGIGTDSPLDYDGESDDLVVYNATHAGITIATADTTARGNLRFADGNAGAHRYRGAVEYDHNADSLSFRASGVSTMYIQSEKVGIGTSSPSTLLDLQGPTNPELRITDTDPGSAAAATFRAENSSVTLGAYSDDPLYLVANNSTKMTVTAGGDVGIGTTSPQSQLNVAGSSSSSNGSQLRLSQGSAVNKRFNIGYHTGAAATQNVDYGKVEVYNASEPGGAKYMPLSLQPTSGSVVIGSTEPQGLLSVSGDTYTQRLFITGAGGSWGQIGETLTGGEGISSFTYDALGGGEMGVSVDDTVLRTTDISQTILGDRNFTGTVTIGTLNVTGTQNIISTDSLVSNGPTFTLNTGVGGTNSYDIGWVGERGSDLNIAVLWKESNDQFELISTSGISGGATNPSFSVSGYKGLKVGHLTNTGQATVKTSTPMGDLSVSGSTYSEELYITGIDGSWERVGVQGHDQASSFNTPLSAGSSVYTINFPKTFGAVPVVNTTVQNSAGGAIIPHMISGVGVSSYSVVFGSTLPDANYSVNTSARPSAKTDDGTVTQSFSSPLSAGVTSETISYPTPFSSTPYVNVTIEGDGGSIVPYYISGVSTTNYDVVFGGPIPANYKIHTFAVR